MIPPAALVSGGLTDPLDVGEPLDNWSVGKDGAKYGQISTSSSKDERWARALFEDFLGLKGLLRWAEIGVKATNLRQNKTISKGMCCSSQRVPPHTPNARLYST